MDQPITSASPYEANEWFDSNWRLSLADEQLRVARLLPEGKLSFRF
jgi:hypothetical protein